MDMKTSYISFALAITLLALGACNQEELGGELPAMSGENISFATAEDSNSTLIVEWKGMWKDEKVEHWEYKIIT